MRVLLTTDTIGGVWTFTQELARGLLLAGHQVALVSFGRRASPAQAAAMQALDTLADGRFRFVTSNAPLEWMEANERAWPEGCEVLEQVIHDFCPDIIHSGQLCFGSLQVGVPVLVTAHSDVLSWAEGVLGGVAELERMASPGWLPRFRKLAAQGLAGAAALVAPTRWMAEELARHYGLTAAPEVIANGVTVPKVQGAVRKLQAVSAGRLWDQAKGLAILREVQCAWPVLVAGDGEVAGAASLGELPHEELLQLFRESAVYLSTSVYEPFGLAPLEAASCGCAVLARDLPSLREVWGDAALYFDSAAALERVLASLAAHPQRLEGAQCRAGQRAAGYSMQAMTAQYLTLYKALASAAKPLKEHVFSHA